MKHKPIEYGLIALTTSAALDGLTIGTRSAQSTVQSGERLSVSDINAESRKPPPLLGVTGTRHPVALAAPSPPALRTARTTGLSRDQGTAAGSGEQTSASEAPG
jgi:hypothetical protein